MPRRIHLTVPRAFRKRTPRNIILHRGTVPATEREQHTGFHVTTPLRTLLDAADGELSPEHLLAAVPDGIERGLVRLAHLREAELRQADVLDLSGAMPRRTPEMGSSCGLPFR